MKYLLLLTFIASNISGCSNNPATSEVDDVLASSATPFINYAVTKYYPHDSSFFTEGLLFHDGKLFESTGSPNDLPQTKSMIGITELATGKFDKKIELDKSKYFGEGIVFLHNKLYQLTYKNQVGFICDANTFKQTGQFKYSNVEGWSLTTDGTHLIMSDGSDKLTYLDAVALKPASVLKVTENGLPRDSLNELEFIKGFIYANIWQNNSIIKIDPANGKVVGKIDLSSLTFEARNKNPRADVLNGIAYDSITDKIYVTGKMWPNIYELNFTH